MNFAKLITPLFIVLAINTANGQFFNELKKQAKEKTEMAVIHKSAEKVGNLTESAMDKILSPNLDGIMKGSGKTVDRTTLPDTYTFNYKYSLQMITKDGSFIFDYYLNPDESYMGIKMNIGTDMFIVMDQDRQVNVNYINSGGTSIATATSAIDLDEEMDDSFQDWGNYTITELPNKEFLGYDCIGRQMENEEWKFVIYMAPDMEVNFANIFKQDINSFPPSLQAYSEQFENSLLMYMDMVDKKGKKKQNLSGSMECVGVESVDFSIDNSNYQFM